MIDDQAKEDKNMMDEIEFLDSTECFDAAIQQGCFVTDERHENYAGNFMYMGSYPSYHSFKHIDTRVYVKVPRSA